MGAIYYSELGRYMIEMNLTVKMVAKACNVGLKTVYNWINKSNKPKDVIQLNKLATVLNIDIEVLKKYFKD